MRDALYEESARSLREKKEVRMYTVFHVVSILFLIMTIFMVFACFYMIPALITRWKNPMEGDVPITGAQFAVSLVFWIVPVVMLGLATFFFFRFKLRFNLSYDYLFVEDELRITKVFNGRKRKHIITMKADNILKIGNALDEDSFEDTVKGLAGRKPKYMTPNDEPAEGKEFVYVLHSSTIEKNVYVIECRMEMLEYLVRAVGRNKFEWKK